MTDVYFRCNSGHYFSTEYCPFDGWTHPRFSQVIEISSKLKTEGKPISIEILKLRGISDSVLSRIILIEFGSNKSRFEALSPDGYLVDGKWYNMKQIDSRYL